MCTFAHQYILPPVIRLAVVQCGIVVAISSRFKIITVITIIIAVVVVLRLKNEIHPIRQIHTRNIFYTDHHRQRRGPGGSTQPVS